MSAASKARGIKETLFLFYFLFNDTCTREQTDHYGAVCFRNRTQLFIHLPGTFHLLRKLNNKKLEYKLETFSKSKLKRRVVF